MMAGLHREYRGGAFLQARDHAAVAAVPEGDQSRVEVVLGSGYRGGGGRSK